MKRKGEFAKLHGVSPGRVSQWLSDGVISGAAIVGAGRSARIVVDIANEQLRERLDQTRRLAFNESDQGKAGDPKEDALADPEFASKRAEREGLQADLIRLRLARARGELIPRAAALEAAESAGRAIARSWQALPTWAEEMFSVCQTGGVPALTAWMRAKANEQCDGIADLLFTPEGEAGDHDSDSDEDETDVNITGKN
jgi:phage terminase Nu1 subunit (DNA packaging protein)